MMSTTFASILAAGSPLDHVVDHAVFVNQSGLWVLTNHMIMLIVAAVIMLLVFPAATRRYRSGELVPTGTRNFLEAIILYIRNDVAKPVLGDDTDRFMPLLWTLFFYVLLCNLLGLLPLDAIQNITIGRVVANFHPIYGTATSNFYVTASLAIIVFVVIQFNGIKANGVGGWLHHFLGGAPWWLAPIMVPVEFLGMLIKPFALAVRLAANMTAGHILIAVLIGFVPQAWNALGAGGGMVIGVVSVVSSVAIMILELFVALLQAYLFTFLSALFISQMLVHHDEEHHEEAGHEHAHDTTVKPAH